MKIRTLCGVAIFTIVGIITMSVFYSSTYKEKTPVSQQPIKYSKDIREIYVPAWDGNHDGNPLRVAILLGASSRNKEHVQSVEETKLFKYCLPSILWSSGYDAHKVYVYIAIDSDDDFWSSKLSYFESIKKPSNIIFKPTIVRGGSFVRAVNEIARMAYADGMDYFLRINEDSEILTPRWASLSIRRLREMQIQDVGVIAPLSFNDRPDIFTHDMTSRNHLEIFSLNYYPTVFSNWYIDDWMSNIYNSNSTIRLKTFHVLHHEDSKPHYIPDKYSKRHLKHQISIAHRRIKKWLKEKKAATIEGTVTLGNYNIYI